MMCLLGPGFRNDPERTSILTKWVMVWERQTEHTRLYSVTGAVPGTPDKAEDMRHPTESHPAGPRAHLEERGKSELNPRHHFTESLLPTTSGYYLAKTKGKSSSILGFSA